MKVFDTFAALSLLLLAGCAPLSIYHRAGVSVARMQSDQTACEVRALRDAPVASQIRQSPPVFVPGRQICNGTKCSYRPGYWQPGEVYSVDVNASLRGRVEARCMARKGYQPVELPLCSGAVRSAVISEQTRVLPRLGENACAIRHQDGSWQIVNPRFKS